MQIKRMDNHDIKYVCIHETNNEKMLNLNY